jgi:hypothetical protein
MSEEATIQETTGTIDSTADDGDTAAPIEETVPAEIDSREGESALEEVKGRILAIPSSEVRQLKVSATSAVGIGLAYARSYAEDRPLFARTFTEKAFDTAEYDNLAERAKAFWQADILMRQETNSEGPFRLLVTAAKPLRTKLMRAASYLWADDPELGDVVSHIRSGNGYANRADDLGSLATLFTEHWARAEGKCDVTLEDIAEAESVGADILRAMSPSRSEAYDDMRSLRNRAAEYLRRGIEEVRAGAAYIYRDSPGEMERYPSLFAGRKRKSGNGKANGDAAGDSLAPPAAQENESLPDTPIPEQESANQPGGTTPNG